MKSPSSHGMPDTARTDDAALQQMVDALTSLPDLDDFIPAALRIVADAFRARDCTYFEHRRGELARLRYWLFNQHVYSPQEIANLQQEEFAFMRQLESGIEIPDTYFGHPFRQRTRATIVDHSKKEPPSVFDAFCNSRGWHLELNVPLVVAGEADGALIIYRGIDDAFVESETILAERLGRHLALAMETSRLSAAARQNAVARERETAAQHRGDELARHSEVLSRAIDALVSEDDFLHFIGRMLGIFSEQLRSPVVEYWFNDAPTRTHLVLTSRDGTLYSGSDVENDIRVRGLSIASAITGELSYHEKVQPSEIDMIEDRAFREYAESQGIPVQEWCRERGIQRLIILPLVRTGISYGSICFYVQAHRAVEEAEMDLACSLAQQVSLAVRMTELAEQSKQTALSRERELAAQDRAVELSRVSEVVRAMLDKLSHERDLENFPRTILKEAMEQVRARDGVIFVLDQEAKTLSATTFLGTPESQEAALEEFADPVPLDNAQLWTAAASERAPLWIDLERDAHLLVEQGREWHRVRGNHSLVITPMYVNTELYGYFCMALQEPGRSLSKLELGLIQALAQQASLAIQLTHVAEESQRAALAQERERDAEERAAQFAHANSVIRSALDQLAGERSLHSFPRTILKQAMHQTGARDGLILIFDGGSDTLTPMEYVFSEDPDGIAPPEFARPFRASATGAWNALLETRSPIVFDVQRDAERLLSGLAGWHRRRGNKSIIAVPMFIEGQPYGYFGITLGQQAAEVSKLSLGLVQALAHQATLAIQLTQLAEASQKNAIMLERQQVIVQERAHMAREIHDKLAQGYAAILMQQKALRRSIKTNGEALYPHLDIIEKLSKDNLAEARRTMDELKFNAFEQGSLHRALYSCMDQSNTDATFNVQLTIETELPPVPRYVEAELSRLIGEALLNARRHSRARSADLRVQRINEKLVIGVSDDGVGFDSQAHTPSFGIPSMYERAARAGADLEITSSPGKGCEVRLVLGL